MNFVSILETRSSSSGCQGFGVFLGLSLWLADGCFLAVSSHGLSFVQRIAVA